MRAVILASLGSLLLAAAAAANSSPPQSPVTKQLTGMSCSISAPFSLTSATGTMSYRGGVSCAGGAGQKTLDVVLLQV